MKKVLKSILSLAVCAALVIGLVPSESKAVNFTNAETAKLDNVSKLTTLNPTTSFPVVSEDNEKPQYNYFEINIPTDSWVYISGSYTNKNWDTGETATELFTNNAMTNKLDIDLNLSFGTGTYNEKDYGFLKAGKYFMKVTTKKKPWYYLTAGYGKEDPFKATCNLTIATIPVTSAFNILTTLAPDKKSVTVTFKNNLGSYLDFAQYRSGYVAPDKMADKDFWKSKIMGIYTGSSTATVMDLKSDTYSFTVTKNGTYTFLVQSNSGIYDSRYSTAIKINAFDNTKPVVTGVKNGKTYKKAVKIKFYDKQSGIKSATLNKKAIKSGKKVSKNGKYKLVVTDKAGNKTTVKFTIKKKTKKKKKK